MHSLPPSIETEIRDDMSTRTIPRPGTTYLPSSNRSPAMSDVAPQSAAVADLSNELERQSRIAEYELQQREIRESRQLETVRQEAASELHSITQTLTESHRNEATTAIAYVSNLAENALNRLNLTENALNRLNKQNQELQQMAENDERLDARTRQLITARRNQRRNQAKYQESPERAKPNTKIEPKPTTNVENPAVEDDGSPEENHPHKGKRGRPSNNPKFIKKYQEQYDYTTIEKTKTPTMTPKRMRTEPEHIGEKRKEDI